MVTVIFMAIFAYREYVDTRYFTPCDRPVSIAVGGMMNFIGWCDKTPTAKPTY
jgi:hypothetical protein